MVSLNTNLIAVVTVVCLFVCLPVSAASVPGFIATLLSGCFVCPNFPAAHSFRYKADPSPDRDPTTDGPQGEVTVRLFSGDLSPLPRKSLQCSVELVEQMNEYLDFFYHMAH